MRIVNVQLTGRNVIICIHTRNTKDAKTKVLHLNFNNTDWYFKVVDAVVYRADYLQITAESYGYWADIRDNIESVEDFGKMIELEPDIVTDLETLESLQEESCWC